jgi:type IV secretory pathway TraG/TraD family ATPase VirD4
MRTIQQQIQQNPIVKQIQAIDSNTWGMIGILLALVVWKHLIKDKGGSVGRSRFATPREIKSSRDAAIKAINEPREFSLWIGRPDRFFRSRNGNLKITPNHHTVMVRNANQHILVGGGTGEGKSRFAIDRMGEAGFIQGVPVIGIDLKGEEEYDGTDKTGKQYPRCAPSSTLAMIAMQHGYQVFIVAPGFADSYCLNPLDLIRDSDDIAGCEQLSNTQVANYMPPGHNLNEWDKAGANVITAAIAYVKSLEKGCDMVMVQAVIERLSMDPESIMGANLSPYVRKAFSQYIASIRSEKTAASIMFAAQGPASSFIRPGVTGTYCRRTNIPIILGRKQMVIFRVDSNTKKTVLPITVACFEMLVNKNIKAGKVSNGIVLTDELPQYKVLSLSDILATGRSQGWSVLAGIQGFDILAQTYGKELANSMLENFKNRIYFAMNSDETAKKISDALGDEDIKSRSRSTGKSHSTNTSDSVRKLVTPAQIQKQKAGRALLLLSTIQTTEQGVDYTKVPYFHKFVIPKHEKRAMKLAEKQWINYREVLKARSRAQPFSTEEIDARDQYAAQLFPSSPKKQTIGKPPSKEQMDAFFSTKS